MAKPYITLTLDAKNTELFQSLAEALKEIYETTKEEETKKIIETALKGAGVEI